MGERERVGVTSCRPGGVRSGDTLDIVDIRSDLSQAVLQETRLRILAVLASPEAGKRGGYSLQELGQMLGCSAQNAHHHLKILEKEGAARVTRTEATQRIPRQFWVTEIRRIRVRPAAGTALEVEIGLPERTLRHLAREVKEWAEENGTAEHEERAVQVAAFLSELEAPAAKALLRVLKASHDGL